MNRLLVIAGGIVMGAVALFYSRSAKAATTPQPGPSPNPNLMNPTYPPSAPFQSKIANVALHSSGWVPFHGLMVTALPLVDVSVPGRFARLSYADAVAYADSIGAMLLTTELVDAINNEGLMLEAGPTELVRTAYDASHLQNASYDEAIDKEIKRQLLARGWDGKTPVGNGWKDWIRGAVGDNAFNYGWRNAAGHYVQPVHVGPSATPHRASYFDYSQLTRLVKGA